MRSRENFNSEAIFIRPSCCRLCYFEPRYIYLGLKPLLLTQFRMYQMYLSSQSSVLIFILNQVIYQRALNSYQQPILENVTITLSIVTINAFSFVISFVSLWTITFIYFISNLIIFINSVLKLY